MWGGEDRVGELAALDGAKEVPRRPGSGRPAGRAGGRPTAGGGGGSATSTSLTDAGGLSTLHSPLSTRGEANSGSGTCRVGRGGGGAKKNVPSRSADRRARTDLGVDDLLQSGPTRPSQPEDAAARRAVVVFIPARARGFHGNVVERVRRRRRRRRSSDDR